MSLQPESIGIIPEETVRVARTIFPDGNVYMRMRDEIGLIYEDAEFKSLFSRLGQPALAPWRLVLVTVMHFAEKLTDRQAADAVRTRIDWSLGAGIDGYGF